MKLFTKYNRIAITTSVIIFMAGSFAFYLTLRYVMIRQLDDVLRTERAEILQYLNEHHELPEMLNTKDQWSVVRRTAHPLERMVFTTEKGINPHEHGKEWLRKIQFTLQVHDELYEISIYKSQEGTDDMIKLIILIAIVMIALILLAGNLINRTLLKKLWQPFYHTIDTIKEYQLTQDKALRLPGTGVEEFTLLNTSVSNMTERAQHEYQVLKEFTGNAAHEMQTPLAVIATHTDALMQDEQLLHRHAASIASIEQSVGKLAKLNQSLLLLAKIEHGRFELNQEVRWDELLQQKLNEWQELITGQNLKVSLSIVPVTTVFHEHLADIVISNLLNNSIRYNIAGGHIAIILNHEGFSIANTPSLPALDTSKLFNRFFRQSGTGPDGNGLGLSIIKQVCELAHHRITYQYTHQQHVFTIFFSNSDRPSDF